MRKVLGSILSLATRVLHATFGAASWAGWLAIVKAAFGLSLDERELALFQELTGRTRPPAGQVREFWLIVGRRAGKSIIAALIAIFATCCCTYTLAPGEVGIYMVIAADRKQARVVKRYISGLLRSVALLTPLIESETADAIYLTNGLVIEIHTASFRTLRGYTVIGAACDEICFWRGDEDSANIDTEILNALRPAMATVPEAMLVVMTSPHAKRGEAWKTYRDGFGKDRDDILIVQAETRALNPTVSADLIAKAYADDPDSASAEYGAQWRQDISSFVSRDALAAVTIAGRVELPPSWDESYSAFADPAGGGSGTGADAFACAIVHKSRSKHDAGKIILDKVLEQRPPFSPEATVAAFAKTLRAYGITRVHGDKWAGEWPTEQFRRHGITYIASPLTKSEIYQEFLPLLNSRRIELLDEPRLLAQLAGLERRTSRAGRDSIDHGPGGHDDVCNAVAGALINAIEKQAGAAFMHVGWV